MAMTDLWVEASTDTVADEHERRMTAARIAAADITSSLVRSASKGEFANRKALYASRLDDICKRIAVGDPTGFAVLRSDLEASLDRDFDVVEASRQEEQQRINAPRAAARAAARKEAGKDEWTQDGDAWVYSSGGRRLRATEKGWSISNPTGMENSGVASSLEEAKSAGLSALPGPHQQKSSARYADDPYWIDQVKYAGRCSKCGAAIPRGARAWYWPLSKKQGRNPLECAGPNCGEASSTRFAAEAMDEDMMGGRFAKVASSCKNPGTWIVNDSKDDIKCTSCGAKIAPGETHAYKRTAAEHSDGSGQYRVEVTGIGENVWSANSMSYDTEEEAERAGSSLMSRWMGADMMRVVPESTPRRESVDPGDPSIRENHRRASLKKGAISLTNVGIDPATQNGVGTDPSGKRVQFRLSDKDRESLKHVLFSDLAVNFSGVDVSPDEIIAEGYLQRAVEARSLVVSQDPSHTGKYIVIDNGTQVASNLTKEEANRVANETGSGLDEERSVHTASWWERYIGVEAAGTKQCPRCHGGGYEYSGATSKHCKRCDGVGSVPIGSSDDPDDPEWGKRSPYQRSSALNMGQKVRILATGEEGVVDDGHDDFYKVRVANKAVATWVKEDEVEVVHEAKTAAHGQRGVCETCSGEIIDINRHDNEPDFWVHSHEDVEHRRALDRHHIPTPQIMGGRPVGYGYPPGHEHPFEAAADDGSIYCKRCKGNGMVNMGGAVRNCTTCKGTGIKLKVRKQVDKDMGPDFLGDHEAAYSPYDPAYDTVEGCPRCEYTSRSHSDLGEHIRKHHPGIDTDPRGVEGAKTAGDKPPWLNKGDDKNGDAAPGDQAKQEPEQPDQEPEGDVGDQSDSSHLDPSQMQAGQQVTIDYTLTGSAAGAGNCPATFESFDGTTAYFTYEGGRFAVTQQGGKWVDAAGTEFDFQLSGDPTQPPVDPNQPPQQTPPPQQPAQQPPAAGQQQPPANPFEKKKSALAESLSRTLAALDDEEREEVLASLQREANPFSDDNPFSEGGPPAPPAGPKSLPGTRPVSTKPRQVPKGAPPPAPMMPVMPSAPVVPDQPMQQGFA